MSNLKCPICQSTDIDTFRDNPDDHGMCWETYHRCKNCGRTARDYDWEKLTETEKLTAEIERLKADNERLKKALQAFIKWDKDYPPGGNPMSGFYEFNSLISDAQFLLWELERNGKDTNVTTNAPDTNVGTKGGA